MKKQFVYATLFAFTYGHSLLSSEIQDHLSHLKQEYDRLTEEQRQEIQKQKELNEYYAVMYGDPDAEWVPSQQAALENSHREQKEHFFESYLLFLRSAFPTLWISQKAWGKIIADIGEEDSFIPGKDNRRQERDKRQKKYKKVTRRHVKKLCRQGKELKKDIDNDCVASKKQKKVLLSIQQRKQMTPPVKKGLCPEKVGSQKPRKDTTSKEPNKNEILLQCAVLCRELVRQF